MVTLRTCENCKYLIYPTMMGYACKKRKLWGSCLPLYFDGYECKKWKLTNRKDDVNGFVPAKFLEKGTYYYTKNGKKGWGFSYDD